MKTAYILLFCAVSAAVILIFFIGFYVSWWGSKFISGRTEDPQLTVFSNHCTVNSGIMVLENPSLNPIEMSVAGSVKILVFDRMLGTYLRTDIPSGSGLKIKLSHKAFVQVDGVDIEVDGYELVRSAVSVKPPDLAPTTLPP